MITLTSVYLWFASVSLILAWYPIMLVGRLFDRDPVRRATGRLFRKLGVMLTRINPLWHVNMKGSLGVNSQAPYVVVSNHQSLVDIPVLCHLPWDLKWLAKRELFSLPVVGRMLKLAGDIPVDRGNPRDAIKTIRRARSYLKMNCSVMVFAEGSRSVDGTVQPFLQGAFRLAIEAGVPILPVVVNGTSNCLPKNSWQFGRARGIQIELLAPVSTQGLKRRDAELLANAVRSKIVERLEEIRSTESD